MLPETSRRTNGPGANSLLYEGMFPSNPSPASPKETISVERRP